MKRFSPQTLLFLVYLLSGFAGSSLLLAHHSFTAEFDDKQPVRISGTITKLDWVNPHVWFYADVKTPEGGVTNWGFSGGAPSLLTRRGITREQLRAGTSVVIEGYRAKDGSANASGGRVTFADGSSILTAGSVDKVPGDRP